MAATRRSRRGAHVSTTPFPARPSDVIALSVREFTDELDLHGAVSIDCVGHRFLEDANRGLVWFIRFSALRSWSVRGDTAHWLESVPARLQRACELAARFDLNDHWEFDDDEFRTAVQSVAE